MPLSRRKRLPFKRSFSWAPLLTALVLFLASAVTASAANSTTAGTASARPGSARLAGGSLLVQASYTGDDNGNNTLRIEWGYDGVDFSLGSQTLSHAASPYSYTITPLDNTKKYQVRVTWQDADNGANPQQVLTGLRPYVTLLHNAVTTGSGTSKWAGGWGTADAGSKYGEFTCSTCHGRGAGNIKQVKTTIVSPNVELGGSENFPGSTVTFTDSRAGSSDFGNDTGGHLSSYKVCEICHSRTNYHRYDTTGQPGGTAHYNQADCTICHKHSEGFKANCTGCHGDATAGNFWPDDSPSAYPDRIGAHSVHVQKIGNWLASGHKDNGTFTTLAHKNGSCNFCHANPGGTGHNDNTVGSPANTADAFGDGWNAAGFRNFSGGTDPDGAYNPAIKRCSAVDCHSNGEFTWSWYGDALAPGQITDLAATTGTAVGTAKLTWTSPGNDGGTGPISYYYEVRYRTGGAVTDANWATSTIAGGPPSVLRPGSAQSMTVAGLSPGTTYYFAVKTADEAGNLSPASNSVSAVAKTDTFAPSFMGLSSAKPAYATGAVDLEWAEAADDTGPVTYLVYYGLATLSTADLLNTTPKTTQALKYQVTGLTNGLDYKFLVRARDASPAQNVDTNTRVKEAIPQAPSENPINGKMYYAVNSTSAVALGGGPSTSSTLTCSEISWGGSEYRSLLNTSGYTCSDGTKVGIKGIGTYTGNIITWVFNTSYPKKMNIHGATFSLYIKEKSDTTGNTATFDLGYWNTSTGAFVQLDTVSKTLGKKSRGSVKAYFPSVDGTVFQIPANMKLAIRLRKTNTKEFEIRYGSNKGNSMLSVYEQESNDLPGTFTVTTPADPSSGTINLSWTAAADPDGDQVTYDVYGSIDGGSTWPYTIAKAITTTSTSWDTKAAGIGLTASQPNVKVRVGAADGYLHRIFAGDPGGLTAGTFHDHRYTATNAFSINNSSDTTPPAAITDLIAEHRPRAGTVYLYWHAPGEDGTRGRASQYDIRYASSLITDANWGSATQVAGEPPPGEPGLRQGFEVTGLTPGATYYFAIKTADEAGNWSALSNVAQAAGGQRCGVCHNTPADDVATKGSHSIHGYTQTDCSKCHGQEADSFTPSHMDGVIKMAWNNPKKGYTNTAVGPTTLTDSSVIYKNQAGTVTVYNDSTGGGGFNNLDPAGPGDNVDNGTCSGFNGTNATGCHGTGSPAWGNRNSVSCAMCHGDPARTNVDPYGRPFDDATTDTRYAGNVPIYKAAPPIDLLGNSTGKAVGQHLRHLNFSYRLTGDQCKLCHIGNDHADGTVNVRLHSAAGTNAQWNAGNPGTCSGTTEIRCHGNNATNPPWQTRSTEPNGPKVIPCRECHGHEDNVFWEGAAVPVTEHTATVNGAVTGNGSTTTITVNSGHTMVAGDRIIKGSGYFVVASTTSTSLTFTKAIPTGTNFASGEVLKTKHIPHTSDGGVVRPCTWCHVEGHPQGATPAGEAVVFIPNNAAVGIDFTSGGIHLKKTINGRGPYNTEAEICWGCHDAQNPKISEWGYNGISNSKVTGAAITGVTKASPASVTSNGHGLSTGDRIIITMPNGMIELNGWTGYITVTGANTFTLNGVNSSGWSTTFSSTGARWKYATAYDSGVLHGNSGSWGSRTPVSNWISAYWDSPNFPYKTAQIQSTHSVNPDVTRPGVDTVAQIRCVYCHDVHDMNRAPGDTANGRPFLRGTWQGNPYLEDGAPGRFKGYNDLASAANKAQYYYDGSRDDFGMVPRGSTAMPKMGGYWIDQNSGYPTAQWSLQSSAGLCTLCHGTDVNNMNKFNVQADGTAESTRKSWVGTNGHSNAVLGGSGTNKFNVYDPAYRSEGTSYNDPGMGYQDTVGASSDRMYGLRNNGGNSTYIQDGDRGAGANSIGVYPYAWSTTGSTNRYAYEEFAWGVNRDTGTTAGEPMYHRFSCSKCHNPHASRLPRLMITNCLDVSHNKWDDNFSGDGDWTSGGANGTSVNWSTSGVMTAHGTGADVSGIIRNKQFAYATSAQNCHRYVDTNGDADGDDAGEAKGWNKLTPWIESGTNYTNN